MTLTKTCTENPFCAKKSRKNPLFGPDCARVASRKSAKTAQFVCFYKHFMTFCFCRPPLIRCAGFVIRRKWKGGFPNPQTRKGLPKTYTRGIYLIGIFLRIINPYTHGGCSKTCEKNSSAPSGLVPLRGGTVLPSAWQTKGALRPR